MKRLLSLTLALLMAAALLGVSGASNYAHAEVGVPGPTPEPKAETEETEETGSADPYLGLWQIFARQDGDEYVSYEEAEVQVYLYFLPSGAIYALMYDGEDGEDEYLAYGITGENALNLYEGEDPIPAVYDPETGVITVSAGSETEPYLTFLQRVAEDPFSDIFALRDYSDRDQKFFGYQVRDDDQVLDLVEFLAIVDEDPGDYYYLELRPDGTGYAQFGSEEMGGEIRWSDTELIAVGNEDEPAPYTRAYGHLLLNISGTVMDFAPTEEVEALVAMKMTELKNAPAQIPQELAGVWELTKYMVYGMEFTPEQMEEITLILNLNGTAVLYADDQAPAGYRMIKKGEDTWSLCVAGMELFELRYDGSVLSADTMGVEMIFEKADD